MILQVNVPFIQYSQSSKLLLMRSNVIPTSWLVDHSTFSSSYRDTLKLGWIDIHAHPAHLLWWKRFMRIYLLLRIVRWKLG